MWLALPTYILGLAGGWQPAPELEPCTVLTSATETALLLSMSVPWRVSPSRVAQSQAEAVLSAPCWLLAGADNRCCVFPAHTAAGGAASFKAQGTAKHNLLSLQ
jgi:hypothetical protein